MEYWAAVREEVRRLQEEEGLVIVEVELYWEHLIAEAIDRLYVQGMYEAMPVS